MGWWWLWSVRQIAGWFEVRAPHLKLQFLFHNFKEEMTEKQSSTAQYITSQCNLLVAFAQNQDSTKILS
jgi:hypothetical protein